MSPLRAAFFVATSLLGACGAPAPARTSRPAPRAVAPAPEAPAQTFIADAPRTPPGSKEGEEEEAPNNYAGTVDAKTPAAPCDFDRTYRGTIGKTPVSWLLKRKGSEVRGVAAYDRGAGAVELGGAVEADGGLRLTERVGGRDLAAIRVHCDRDSGALRGSFLQGSASQPIRLAPRHAGATPIVERRKKLGELVDGEPTCTWDVRSPAVFGLDDPDRERRINAALRVRFADEVSLEKKVAACPPKSDDHVTGWYSIETDERGVLSVLHNGYVYLGPSVHGQWNAAADAISVDVPTGRKLTLRDVVTSADALRPVLSSCIAFAGEKLDWNDYQLEQNLHGLPADEGEASTVHEPLFLVLPDGIAVLLRGLPTVAAWSELSGPVIEWGALKRAGVLAPRSPIARLWESEPAHAPGVPACRRVFVPKWMPSKDRAR